VAVQAGLRGSIGLDPLNHQWRVVKPSGGKFSHILELVCCLAQLRAGVAARERRSMAFLTTNFLEVRFAMRDIRPEGDCTTIPLAQGVEIGENIGEFLALKSRPLGLALLEGFCHQGHVVPHNGRSQDRGGPDDDS
jgi:hypothetical protein